MDVLEGKGTWPRTLWCVANAGMALFCGDQKNGIQSGLARAKESLESGKALEAFKKLLNN